MIGRPTFLHFGMRASRCHALPLRVRAYENVSTSNDVISANEGRARPDRAIAAIIIVVVVVVSVTTINRALIFVLIQ